MMVPRRAAPQPFVDVTAALDEKPRLRIVPLEPVQARSEAVTDPFAEVTV
jgi:hypothetical protein